MVKQLPLIVVPKTHMTFAERLESWKERNGVWTHHARHLNREGHPWSALALNRARLALAGYLEWDEPDDAMSLIANYCRLLDEWKLLVTGTSERHAIEVLCAYNKMLPP